MNKKYFFPQLFFPALRQLVIIYDVKVATIDKNSTLRKEGAVALLNSTGSTYIHTKESNVETEHIEVIIYNFIYNIYYVKLVTIICLYRY